jgi:beta-lactamase class C
MINQKMIAYMKQHRIPGAAVEVYVDGVPHSYYYGYADKDRKIPVTSNTIFEVGSITKVFTCLLLAEQINAAHMQLNDPATKYLSNFSTTADNHLKNISLQELATHTAGFQLHVPKSVKTYPELMQYFSQWQPSVKIGSQWQYSNIGIGTLGYSLEGLTHQSDNQLYIENILQPLGMEPIGINVPKQLQANYANGYDNKGLAPQINMPLFASAGAMKASGDDMLRFLKAAIGLPGTPRVINQAMRLTQTPFVKTTKMLQGLAWEIREINPQNVNDLISPQPLIEIGPAIPAKQLSKNEQIYDGNSLIEKTGLTDGFRAYMGVIPNRKSGIVILTNRRAMNNDIIQAGRSILLNLDNR